MSERKQRAAVVLFVESGSGADAVDLAGLVAGALRQAGIREGGLTATLNGSAHHIEIVDVMEAGMAARNGYLYTEVTSRAWRDRGRG